MRSYVLVPLLALVLLHNGFLLGAEEIRLEDGDVVAFLGGTNMVRSVRAGALEYYLTDAFVNAETEVRFRVFRGRRIRFIVSERLRNGGVPMGLVIAWSNFVTSG